MRLTTAEKWITCTYSADNNYRRRFITSTTTNEVKESTTAKGITLGRPKGKVARLKLDDKREEIEKYYKMGLSLREIGKLLNIVSSTLSDYIKIKQLNR
ncbi:helix-turn-helix domain-containing protein [Photobacterium aquimaris]|uniref:helix-turn-helix domain-containing protein n=1 Tax=Photobacterium aquimaris TaxID=512643 RepID=UPI0011B228C8|nr:helix-turn-helix domain-containing protein [Photobacterium aquimaris]